jgi:hypothetical protein
MVDIFVLALGAAFYPTLLAIVLLVLSRPRPVRLLGAYLVGGMLAGFGVGFVFVFVLKGAGVDDSGGDKSTASAILDIAGGAISLVLAAILLSGRDPRPARMRKKPKSTPGPKKPSWTQRAVNHDSLGVAFGLGVLLDLPSVWYLLALKDIATGGYSAAGEVALIVAFNLIMFAVIEIPLIAYLLAPDRAAAAVTGFNAWVHSHARQIAEGVAGVVGVYLVAKGVVAL